jgi:hypothetical protein
MDRRCGIDIASTAMSIISLWCVLTRIRGPSLGTLGELVCVVLSRSRLQCIVRVGGRLGLVPSRFDRGSTGSVGALSLPIVDFGLGARRSLCPLRTLIRTSPYPILVSDAHCVPGQLRRRPRLYPLIFIHSYLYHSWKPTPRPLLRTQLPVQTNLSIDELHLDTSTIGLCFKLQDWKPVKFGDVRKDCHR